MDTPKRHTKRSRPNGSIGLDHFPLYGVADRCQRLATVRKSAHRRWAKRNQGPSGFFESRTAAPVSTRAISTQSLLAPLWLLLRHSG